MEFLNAWAPIISYVIVPLLVLVIKLVWDVLLEIRDLKAMTSQDHEMTLHNHDRLNASDHLFSKIYNTPVSTDCIVKQTEVYPVFHHCRHTKIQ